MIVSASRRTDIPNYYAEWFIQRIKKGFLYVKNPMNAHQISRIDLSPELIDCIVFWTKNPSNLMKYLDCLQEYAFYVQFTLTGYGKDVEKGIPDKRKTILGVFQELAGQIGKERVVWRYDPIFITDRYTREYHLKAFEEIARCLKDSTEKVVISFGDFYEKTKRNMKDLGIKEMTEEEMVCLAKRMAEIASAYQLTIETCAERIDLEEVGVTHGSCIDKKMIERLLGHEIHGKKDKGQRGHCQCMESVDVGTYNTCLNGCKYCYANFSQEKVKENCKQYDLDSPLLCGTVGVKDKIAERKMK